MHKGLPIRKKSEIAVIIITFNLVKHFVCLAAACFEFDSKGIALWRRDQIYESLNPLF